MQTLGVSDSVPASESRWRTLLWPTIRTQTDLDQVTRQGFWICLLIAVFTFGFSVFTGQAVIGFLEGLFFFLAGVGMRQSSRVAGIAAFAAYLLSTIFLVIAVHSGFNVVRIIFGALLLATVRGNWQAARWQPDPTQPPELLRLNETFLDKLVDQLPPRIWPKTRYLFYVLAFGEISLLLLALIGTVFAPR